MEDILASICKSPQLPKLLKDLDDYWQAEQKRRHEFWATHDEGIKAEFIKGEIVYHSPVYGSHWMASTNISRFLLPHVREQKLGRVAYEKVMVRCTRNDYKPDICFWTTEKTQDFQKKQSAFPPPDFIIEILSDSTEYKDRGIKMTDYALHGVQEYWIIDTDKEVLEQYLLEGDVFVLNQKLLSGRITSKVIIGFEIELAQIFEGF